MDLDSSLDPASLSSDDLLEALRKVGGPVGPIIPSTRNCYERALSSILRSDAHTSLNGSTTDDPLIVSLQFGDEDSGRKPSPPPTDHPAPPTQILLLPDIASPKDPQPVNNCQNLNTNVAKALLGDSNGIFVMSTSTPKDSIRNAQVMETTHEELEKLSRIEMPSQPVDMPSREATPSPIPPFREDSPPPSDIYDYEPTVMSRMAREVERQAMLRTKRREIDARINAICHRRLTTPDWLHDSTELDRVRPLYTASDRRLRSASSSKRNILLWVLGGILVALAVAVYLNMESQAPNPFLA